VSFITHERTTKKDFSGTDSNGPPPRRTHPLTPSPERDTLLKFGVAARVSDFWVAGTTGPNRESSAEFGQLA